MTFFFFLNVLNFHNVIMNMHDMQITKEKKKTSMLLRHA